MENLWIDKFIGDPPSEKNVFEDKFFLYPAATWEHKNHINLIKAVHSIREKKGLSIKIICTGNKTEHYNILRDLLVDLNLSENFDFLGIVDDSTLFALYLQAHGVVVPSLYEAGSFPLMESILLQRPVICSNVTSLPETINADEFVFDPNNIEQMSELIYKLWTDDRFRERNLEIVEKRSKIIRFNDSFSKFMNLYSSMVSLKK
jgi:glycosyltransferase involved in cell wall biosynthesis